jgi:ribosomal protein S18 acetylase RimI-like enzyme
MPALQPPIKSLVWATDLDVIKDFHERERRDDHWVIRSPDNPGYWWGNFLLFDDAPQLGDGERWEALFAAEFADTPEVKHRAFAWDRTDGEEGLAREEFGPRGYEVQRTTGLLVKPSDLTPRAQALPGIEVRALDPAVGVDDQLWSQVIDVQAAGASPETEPNDYRDFLTRRQRNLRESFRSGAGSWFVALDGAQVVASLGIVVTDGRARYQSVDTLASHRRRRIASRLVGEAARVIAEQRHVEHFVIAADPGYHAAALYESLGFRAVESVRGVQRMP